MAKGDPNSVTVQYKVHLKPTALGRLVIERLARPHLDVSPELRRLIELGYAAEQAGFILDGTILRHAGRTWDIQPDLTAQMQSQASTALDQPAAEQPRPASRRSAKTAPETGSPGLAQPEQTRPGEKADIAPTTGSSLRGKLRGLSG